MNISRFSILDFQIKIFDGSTWLTTSFRFQIGNRQSAIFFVVFVTLFVLTFSTESAYADSAAENGRIPMSIGIRGDPNGPQRLELLRAEMSLPKSRQEEESKDKLKRMIEQVRSVQFESLGQAIEPSVVPDKVAMPEPNETLFETPPQRTKKAEQAEGGPPRERLTDRTLEILKDLLQHPDRLNDPLELGEILFASGNTKDAAPFYREALKRTDPNNVGSSGDRAWILFQTGNCLRTHEPAAAAEIYRQLLIEYPNSPWADLAKAQQELIEWRLKEKPNELIAKPGNDL